MKVGVACPAFFCSQDGNLTGLCHGGDFCVVVPRKQLEIFGHFLRGRREAFGDLVSNDQDRLATRRDDFGICHEAR